MTKLNLTYHHTWNGHCQVYYKDKSRPGRLYCMQLQNMRTGDFLLCSASKDGEPCCPIKPGYVASIQIPPADANESTDNELRAFLARTPADQINR